MAKKSAKSKGYRKAAAKKPYLTKRDITILVILLVAVAIGAYALFSYDDGALKVQDGAIVDRGDNWLIVNGASSGGHRYYKLGEAGAIDGYTRSSTPLVSDANLATIDYTPETEDAPVRSIQMSTNAASAQRCADYYRSLVQSLDPTEVTTQTAGDVEYRSFSYQTAYHVSGEEATEGEAAEGEATEDEAAEGTEAAAEEEEAAPNRFEQAIHAYVDAAHNSSIAITVVINAQSESDFMTEDQLAETLSQAIAQLTLEK